MIRKMMEDWMREECVRRGYLLVYTPHVMRRDLWKVSGHDGVYSKDMFPPMKLDDAEYRLKPMNCPGHILIYKNSPKSYRDLPQRYAEFGNVYRYERSGTMHGLLRVRGFTQDDAHIFCTPEQIEGEIIACLDFAEAVLKTFGFKEYRVELSTRDPQKGGDFFGTAEDWAHAEGALKKVLIDRGLTFKTFPGEAAFYGPKIDVKLIDVLGRPWQLSTVQFDFNLPARFELEYVGEDGERHQPVMVHRALSAPSSVSSESSSSTTPAHFRSGSRPCRSAWSPSANATTPMLQEVEAELKAAGLRVEVDARNEKMNAQNPRLRQPEDALHSGLRRQGRSRRLSQRPHPRQRRPGLHAAGRVHRQSQGSWSPRNPRSYKVLLCFS